MRFEHLFRGLCNLRVKVDVMAHGREGKNSTQCHVVLILCGGYSSFLSLSLPS